MDFLPLPRADSTPVSRNGKPVLFPQSNATTPVNSSKPQTPVAVDVGRIPSFEEPSANDGGAASKPAANGTGHAEEDLSEELQWMPSFVWSEDDGVERTNSGLTVYSLVGDTAVQTSMGARLDELYNVEKELGSGTYGTVSIAVCKWTGARRAVKTMKREDIFRRECSMAKKLKHPNVVNLIDIFKDEKGFHLVMDLCTGGELGIWIHSRHKKNQNGEKVYQCPEVNECIRCITEMLSPLVYLHYHRICHRDVKAGNYIIERAGSPTPSPLKLIDFGLSTKFPKHGSVMKATVGTLGFTAPEVLSREGYDERCDVWSFGVCCYLLFDGRNPFVMKSTVDKSEALRITLETQPLYRPHHPQWENYPKVCEHFCQSLLKADPKNRPLPRHILSRNRLLRGNDASKEVNDSAPCCTIN